MRSRRTRVRFPPPPRLGVHEKKPGVFMKPIVGGGDESLTLRHPSKCRNRRPSGRRFLLEPIRFACPGAPRSRGTCSLHARGPICYLGGPVALGGTGSTSLEMQSPHVP